MSLEKMIADAAKAVEESEGEEKVKAEATVEALTKAKEAGYTFTQSDLNSAEKSWKEEHRSLKGRVEGLVGNFDEFEKVVKAQIPPDDAEDGKPKEGDETRLLERFQGELKSRDDALEKERNDRLQFQRELKQERLSHQLERTFKDLGLQESYQDAAREFVSPRLSSIVDKAMEGEDVSEDLQSQAERVKELSRVWFEAPPQNDVGPALPGRSPNGGEPRQLTDEEREARSESVI